MRFIILALGAIVGAVIGCGLGVLLAVGVGLNAQMMSPDDPTAFSVATIVVGTAPGGFLFGIPVGIACAYPLAELNNKNKFTPKTRHRKLDELSDQDV